MLVSAPSAVFDATESTAPGINAWHALRRQPRSTSSRHMGAVLARTPAAVSSPRASALVAAELSQHLAKYPVAADERVWIAAPALADAGGLGMIPGIAQSLGLTVDGFVDAAAVTVSTLGVGRSSLVLELGLHHAAVTAVESGGQARRRRVLVSEQGGLIELYEARLTFISTAMVKLTRFDPFTNADTEQQLFDALPALTREAAEGGQTTAAVSNGDNKFEVSLSRDQFAESALPVYRELIRLLHALRPAGADVSIVMPESRRGAARSPRDASAVRRLRARGHSGRLLPPLRHHCSICRSPKPGNLFGCCVECRSRSSRRSLHPCRGKCWVVLATVRRRRRTCCSKGARSARREPAGRRSLAGNCRCGDLIARWPCRYLAPSLHLRARR